MGSGTTTDGGSGAEKRCRVEQGVGLEIVDWSALTILLSNFCANANLACLGDAWSAVAVEVKAVIFRKERLVALTQIHVIRPDRLGNALLKIPFIVLGQEICCFLCPPKTVGRRRTRQKVKETVHLGGGSAEKSRPRAGPQRGLAGKPSHRV